MSRYKAYPEYKDSGVEWCNSLPARWEVKRISHISQLRSGDAIVSDQIELEGDYPVYGGNGLRGYCSNFNLDGDFVLIGRQGALCGNVHHGSGKFWASEHALVVYPLIGMNIKWFGEMLRAMNLNQYNVSAAQPGLAVTNITCLRIPFPSKEEQDLIAAFLDHETAKIDALIEKQQWLIELLKEKRQAVISHAVTKGLDPNAPMKDSGVEWLGEVPAHWTPVQLKHLCLLLKDGTHLPPARVDEGIPLLSVRNIINNNFLLRDDDSLISHLAYEELCKPFSPMAGDVLLAIVGATLGKVAVVPDMPFFHIQRSLAIFRVNPNLLVNEFLANIFCSSGFQNLLWENTGFSAQPGIYLGALANFKIPVPPMEEQFEIIGCCRRESRRLDKLISKAECAIELMQERRTALISAAVTGKIDVRDWQPAVAQEGADIVCGANLS